MSGKRRVNVFKEKYDPDEPYVKTLKKELIGTGTFHGWGVDHEPTGDNSGAYTCAIVEYDDGKVGLEYAGNVEFVKEEDHKCPYGDDDCVTCNEDKS